MWRSSFGGQRGPWASGAPVNSWRVDGVSIRRSYIVNVDDIPKQTVTNMISAAGNFERWLQMSRHGDFRNITTIPPATLDSYLVEFFTTVKRPSGEDYKLLSLQTLRSHLDRYLKECKYPESITSSKLFFRSQQAFASRKHELMVQSGKDTR